MALYREDATGFLVEYATNPGAGYTAVSAMPTDTVANRVAWHRNLDTYGQTSAWHPSIQGAAEDPSPLVLSMSLSQEAHLVSADVNGNVTDAFLGASTTAKVYRGTIDVTTTEGWAFAYTASFCTVTQSTNTFTVTAMSADTATVTITATRTGSPTQTKLFSLAKVRPGAIGVDGIRGSRQILVAGTAWSDQAAWQGIVAQTGTSPVPADMVTIADAASGFSQSKFYSSGGNGTTTWGTWNVVTSYINGNLLVTGTLGADKISTGTMNATTITLGSSSGVIQSGNFVAGTSGFRIRGTGDAEFQNAIIRGTLNAYDLTTGFMPIARIQDATITGAKIANATIANANITDATITGAKIADAAITNAKISALDAAKITTGTLDAARIAANSITTSKLSFTPVQSSNVVASINATTEGVRIAGNRITIDGTVSFGSGYDPSGKISSGGAAADINANATTISGGKITTGSLAADRIDSGTINAKSIFLQNGHIASSNFLTNVSGWVIHGDGVAEFNNVTVRGTLRASDITVGTLNTLQVTNSAITNTTVASGSVAGAAGEEKSLHGDIYIGATSSSAVPRGPVVFDSCIHIDTQMAAAGTYSWWRIDIYWVKPGIGWGLGKTYYAVAGSYQTHITIPAKYYFTEDYRNNLGFNIKVTNDFTVPSQPVWFADAITTISEYKR